MDIPDHRHRLLARRAGSMDTQPHGAARGIAWAATARDLAGNSGALYLRGRQLSLKGAAKDRSLAARVWCMSEQQTGVDPTRSAVATVSAARGPDARSSCRTSRGPDGPGS